MRVPSESRRRGVTVILMSTLLATVVVPMAGLAIDATMLFLIKGKLSAAVDAAALAGARSLSRGLDLASQTSAAQSTARQFFDANFPPGYMNTTGVSFSSTVAETVLRTRTVTIQASVNAPLYLMRIFGSDVSPVAAAGAASRRDVNVILVLDRSGSMQTAGVCGTMKSAARNFVDKFTNGRDRLGLVTFHGSSLLDYAPTQSFKSASPSMDSVIGNLACGGATGSAQALWDGYQQLVAINEPGALNLIVFFTDGNPTALTANFPVKTVADTRYTYSSPYNSLVALGASGCTSAANKLGYITRSSSTGVFGATMGVLSHVSGPINDTSWQFISSRAGCYFGSSWTHMRRDVASIPATDYWGNSTTGYVPVETYPAGHPYAGQLRVDTLTSISAAAINATDSAAARVRADANLRPVIYSIGLGGTGTDPLDEVLLRRVANDVNSPIYDPTKMSGLYVFAPNAAQLDYAFSQVASEILRLSQ